VTAQATYDAEILIAAEQVSKKFASYHRKATSLKERLIRREESTSEDFWALREVDIVVRRGETVGLVGPNGSGKSTFLKVLSGILKPTSGKVTVAGRVASLLELGAGFDGELTGRENVYLNAALLGLTRAETDAIFAKIVAFSELEEFIDNPVKHYSSGMYVRLGFSIAVHVEPDVLIIDEVLAVGDEAFQRKCIDRIEEFQLEGRTILFVSHSSDLVERLCNRAVVLDHGKVIFDGPPPEGTDHLHKVLGVDRTQRTRLAKGYRIRDIDFIDPTTGESAKRFEPCAPATIRVSIDIDSAFAPHTALVRVVLVSDDDNRPDAILWPQDDQGFEVTQVGTWTATFAVPNLPSLTGVFGAIVVVLDLHSHDELAKAKVGRPIILRRPDPGPPQSPPTTVAYAST
jgi:ABC-2 type transport system ATP-binding protein